MNTKTSIDFDKSISDLLFKTFCDSKQLNNKEFPGKNYKPSLQ